MHKYKLTISYNGKQYYGWQLQPQSDRPTIQGVLEASITKLLGMRIPLIASSRTDAGVHALGQVAHCVFPTYIHQRQLFAHFIETLPEDISIRSIEEVPHTFHARSSLYKCYQYTLWYAREKPTPFLLPFVWHTPKLNIALLQQAIPYLIGTHEFALFRNYSPDTSSAIRTVFSIYAEHDSEHDALLRLTFWGNGFVRGMIRNLVGLLVYAGRNKIHCSDISILMKQKHRSKLPSQTAPPQGLLLHHVCYPPHTILGACSSL